MHKRLKPGYYEIKPYPHKSKAKNILQDIAGTILVGILFFFVAYLRKKGFPI